MVLLKIRTTYTASKIVAQAITNILQLTLSTELCDPDLAKVSTTKPEGIFCLEA